MYEKIPVLNYEKLSVLDLDPEFAMFWYIKTTDDLKDFWNGKGDRNFETIGEKDYFLYMIVKHKLELYLKEAEMDKLSVYIEKVKRYDRIAFVYNDNHMPEDILWIVEEVMEKPF